LLGDFVIAFSTVKGTPLPNEGVSPLFQAAGEATEEAICNSLFKATAVRGPAANIEALPLDKTREILKRHGVMP
jgi:D-aminopeptidase